jgi:hypothetical protein
VRFWHRPFPDHRLRKFVSAVKTCPFCPDRFGAVLDRLPALARRQTASPSAGSAEAAEDGHPEEEGPGNVDGWRRLVISSRLAGIISTSHWKRGILSLGNLARCQELDCHIGADVGFLPAVIDI